MTLSRSPSLFLLTGAIVVLIGLPALTLCARDDKATTLRIGTSGTMTSTKDAQKEKSSLATLHNFIKDETGLENDITRLKDWRELGEKMSKGALQVGVFQGYEFAWAQEQYPGLRPLALAVNVTVYPVAYVVTKRDSAAKDFAGLQGQSLCLPNTDQPYLRLFIDHEAQANGKETKDYFSKLTTQDNVEDCIDDVVDGVAQATVIDANALEAYKRRKPGRFGQLKSVAHSQPLPPTVIAYYDKVLDDATRKKFSDGLLNAASKEQGKTMLTFFKLSGFNAVPEDFEKVLTETRKTYPAPKAQP